MKVKQIVVSALTAVSLTGIVGCGKSDGDKCASMAREFGSVIVSSDHKGADEFAEKHISKDLMAILNAESAGGDETMKPMCRAIKKAFGRFSEANGEISVEVVKVGEDNGERGAVVKMSRGEANIYVVFSLKDGQDPVINFVTGDKSEIAELLR